MLPQQVDGRQRFERGNVPRAGHDDVRFRALVIAGPVPDADSRGAMLDRGLHVQILQRGLLSSHDHVDVLPAAQAMIRDGKKRVGVRRQIDAHDVRFFVDHQIDEAGILVREAIVILPPDMRGQQIVERSDGTPPRNPAVTLSHLACWLNMESTMWMNAS